MSRRTSSSHLYLYLLVLVIAVGAALRLLRVTWQPLWWDEGYTVYFATEPIAAMLRLTAQDIHPPLYYALLHAWLLLWGSASPLVLRAFSILVGVLTILAFWWMARLFFPARRGLALWAALLLAISPMHIFYSQEVRMYGLELLLGILSTGFFWQLIGDEVVDLRVSRRRRLLYILATAALLYTEYYAVLLPAAHLLWALWAIRSDSGRLKRLLWADGIVALLYLPWLFYTLPALLAYIPQKVVADADQSLSFPLYLGRHLWAFLSGHVVAVDDEIRLLQAIGVVAAAVLLGIAWLFTLWRRRLAGRPVANQTVGERLHRHSPLSFLALILLLALLVGFVLNLRLPFFPEGGERVLLFVLPYFLLWSAYYLGTFRPRSTARTIVQIVAAVAILMSAAAGILAFTTTPRYTENDYRPLIRQTVEQGHDEDTVFAVFPWQLGYWRAYAPVWGRHAIGGPQPVLSPSPGWGPSVATALDQALSRGTLWFPAHLALGAFLEREIEVYLAAHSIEFESRWYSKTTRLSGWHRVDRDEPLKLGQDIDFGPVQVTAASGITGAPLYSANDILPITLALEIQDPEAVPMVIALRLRDAQERVWASRDIQIDNGDPLLRGEAHQVGLLVPVGLPPGRYTVAMGVRPADALQLLPVQSERGPTDLAPLGDVQVFSPPGKQSPLRLSMQHPLVDPVHRNGIDFLGFSGYDPNVPTLAGTEFTLSLFLHKQALNLPPYQLFVGLLDAQGAGVAGWEGWPLTDYPTSIWPEDALVRVPVSFYLPAALSPGDYTLVAGVIDPATGQRSAPVQLGALPVTRREIRLEAPTPQFPLTPAPQVGTHARLIGYDMDVDGATVRVNLYWEVLQTLLPPHQVFFHLTAADGTILAQDDGVPGRRAVSAPSGTWLTGEIIVDPHEVHYSADLPPGAGVRTGLYLPANGVRLPVLSGSELEGDSIELPLP